ncbi:hypothetical protein QFC22_005636 [Naganishia vaughanmartiniae]|uniref:Uncharacterized protein n=1 Tax=Naganishia vaughanmartiniae TaxID=1424756 RepID=A0ACC2WSM9_9TREE|nr:hypothetical protein QFC22_005636 [Naganishia vaughanmartiniae]
MSSMDENFAGLHHLATEFRRQSTGLTAPHFTPSPLEKKAHDGPRLQPLLPFHDGDEMRKSSGTTTPKSSPISPIENEESQHTTGDAAYPSSQQHLWFSKNDTETTQPQPATASRATSIVDGTWADDAFPFEGPRLSIEDDIKLEIPPKPFGDRRAEKKWEIEWGHLLKEKSDGNEHVTGSKKKKGKEPAQYRQPLPPVVDAISWYSEQDFLRKIDPEIGASHFLPPTTSDQGNAKETTSRESSDRWDEAERIHEKYYDGRGPSHMSAAPTDQNNSKSDSATEGSREGERPKTPPMRRRRDGGRSGRGPRAHYYRTSSAAQPTKETQVIEADTTADAEAEPAATFPVKPSVLPTRGRRRRMRPIVWDDSPPHSNAGDTQTALSTSGTKAPTGEGSEKTQPFSFDDIIDKESGFLKPGSTATPSATTGDASQSAASQSTSRGSKFREDGRKFLRNFFRKGKDRGSTSSTLSGGSSNVGPSTNFTEQSS